MKITENIEWGQHIFDTSSKPTQTLGSLFSKFLNFTLAC